MNYVCCKDTRRNAVKNHPTLNGIDFLEVLDEKTDPFLDRQTTLFVHLLKPVHKDTFTVQNFSLEGGERITNIGIVDVWPEFEAPFLGSPPGDDTDVFAVKVSVAGDFSTYTLHLVKNNQTSVLEPFEGFDQIMASVDFSFKVACEKDFDCLPQHHCAPETEETPRINYLARDYAGFKQLMLDRMSLLAPAWQERNPADLGIVLVELLAYSADYLSYKQDAVATEAYLGTARKRSSVRRHARLADYFMHDGCNARTWLQVQVSQTLTINKEDADKLPLTQFLTKTKAFLFPRPFLTTEQAKQAIAAGVQVFEPLHDATLYPEHNEMLFYTWGKINCCLPQGATKATLLGHFPNLLVNDILILAERASPTTGETHDADTSKRHAVKLTKVAALYDELYAELESPPASPPSPGLPVTEIEWHTEDALPFPLCLSSEKTEHAGAAWGNILLVDHGQTIDDAGGASSIIPSTVPGLRLDYAKSSGGFCEPGEPVENLPLRYRPWLNAVPLTQCAAYKFDQEMPAGAYLNWDMRTVAPAIRLKEDGGTAVWTPLFDLLNAGSNSKNFVVETESDGVSYLRFGDGRQGERPETGVVFKSVYRIGNGVRGNVGINTISHVASTDPAVIAAGDLIEKVWNPLPARGGMEPESMESVRQYAPEAFRTQLRAVTAADYEYFSQKANPEVQRAAATLRWTGSWKTVFLTIDRFSGSDVDPIFENKLRNDLEKYRMAGFDLEVDAPLYVNLEIELQVCVKTNYRAGDVQRALSEVFSNRVLPDGRKGAFHPDLFTFGQPVYLSRLYAAAQAVEGVSSVKIALLRKQGDLLSTVPATGVFPLGRRQIARCDNDPNFPERGILRIVMINGA